jgi:hypothetical protein
MIYPHEQFAIEHMGWKQGDTEPTEQQIIEAIENRTASKVAARQTVLNKLGLTADEVTALLS